MSKKIGKLLMSSNTAISNATVDPKVYKAISLYGYTEERLQEGKLLLDNAEALSTQQAQKNGDKLGASQAMNVARKKVSDAYVPHVKIARIAMKNNKGAFQALELNGKRKRANAARLSQAKTFYTNAIANENYKTALADFGITEDKLKAALNLIKEAENARANYLKKNGEAQNATAKRNLAIEALEEWMSDFIAIARIALEGQSQLMEILGVVVPG